MKSKLLLFAALFIGSQIFSQSIYLKVNGGPNISINSDYFFLWADQIKPVDDSIAIFQYHQSEPYSLGSGRTFCASAGYTFNKNLTFDLAFSFSKSKTQKFEAQSDYTFPAAGYHVEQNYDYSYDATYFSITPSVQLSFPLGDNNVYAVFGLHFSNIEMERKYNMTLYNNIPGYYPSENMETVEEYEKESSLGFKTGAGFELYLTEKMHLTFEASYNYLKYVPTSSKYSKYEYMGESELEDMEINEKEFVYVDSYDDLENNDPDIPQKNLKYSYPFDHLSFQIGIKYSITNFTKESKK